MTIPTSKASTANVDQGSDKISLARPDIKQNIDNVNEIIDHLNAAASFLPAYISYGDEINVTQENVIAPVQQSPRLITAGNTGISIVDGDSAGGQSRISLPAGTYLLETNRSRPAGLITGSGYVQFLGFRDNISGDYLAVGETIVDGAQGGSSTTGIGHHHLVGLQTFSATAQVELLGASSNTVNTQLNWTDDLQAFGDSLGGPQTNQNVGMLVKITKIA